MLSVNEALIVGNLGNDPEVKTWPSGERYTTLSVATNSVTTNKQTGEKTTHTQWHRIVCHQPFAIDLLSRAKKGDSIMVRGAMRSREWTDDQGSKRYAHEIIVGKNGLINLFARVDDLRSAEIEPQDED